MLYILFVYLWRSMNAFKCVCRDGHLICNMYARCGIAQNSDPFLPPTLSLSPFSTFSSICLLSLLSLVLPLDLQRKQFIRNNWTICLPFDIYLFTHRKHGQIVCFMNNLPGSSQFAIHSQARHTNSFPSDKD